jgi:hypothetical protein
MHRQWLPLVSVGDELITPWSSSPFTDRPLFLAGKAQVRSKPKPSSTVPFARDDNFVGRIEIMKSIGERLSAPGIHHRVALVGIGGIG